MNKLSDCKKTDFDYELVDKLETRKAKQQETAKDISDALMPKKKKGLGSHIHQRFAAENSVELELPTRSSPRQAPNF